MRAVFALRLLQPPIFLYLVTLVESIHSDQTELYSVELMDALQRTVQTSISLFAPMFTENIGWH